MRTLERRIRRLENILLESVDDSWKEAIKFIKQNKISDLVNLLQEEPELCLKRVRGKNLLRLCVHEGIKDKAVYDILLSRENINLRSFGDTLNMLLDDLIEGGMPITNLATLSDSITKMLESSDADLVPKEMMSVFARFAFAAGYDYFVEAMLLNKKFPFEFVNSLKTRINHGDINKDKAKKALNILKRIDKSLYKSSKYDTMLYNEVLDSLNKIISGEFKVDLSWYLPAIDGYIKNKQTKFALDYADRNPEIMKIKEIQDVVWDEKYDENPTAQKLRDYIQGR